MKEKRISKTVLLFLAAGVMALSCVLTFALLIPVFHRDVPAGSQAAAHAETLSMLCYGTTDFHHTFPTRLMQAAPKAEVENYPTDCYYNILSVLLLSNNCPDVVMLTHPEVVDVLLPADQLYPVDSLVQFDWSVCPELNAADKHAYASPPLGTDPYVLYYNQSLAGEIGLQINHPTVETLSACCAVARSQGYDGIAMGTRSTASIRNVVVQMGGVKDADVLASALKRYEQLSPWFSEDAGVLDYDDVLYRFSEGRTCFYFGTRLEQPILEEVCDFQLGRAYVQLNGRCSAWYEYYGMLALCKNSQNKSGAMRLIKAFASDESRRTFSAYTAELESRLPASQYPSEPQCSWFYRDGGAHLRACLHALEQLQYAG